MKLRELIEFAGSRNVQLKPRTPVLGDLTKDELVFGKSGLPVALGLRIQPSQ